MNTGRFPVLRLMRPMHWVKNGLIFLPMLLAGLFTQIPIVIDTMIGFVSFSLMASAGYILNDIRDVERDRKHTVKSHRPLASAAVSTEMALGVAAVLIVSSLATSFLLGKQAVLILMIYFVLNFLYSTFLKSIRFFDIIILSSFYLIRLYYGSAISGAELTEWFVATTTFSFITLSANKRQFECELSKHDIIAGRGYTKEDATMLQMLSVTFAVGTLVLLNMHAFFVLRIHSPIVIGLINLFAAGMMFSYFDNRKTKSDDPVERILKNPLLLITTVLFVLIYVFELMRGR